jgi:hypothetical protein
LLMNVTPCPTLMVTDVGLTFPFAPMVMVAPLVTLPPPPDGPAGFPPFPPPPPPHAMASARPATATICPIRPRLFTVTLQRCPGTAIRSRAGRIYLKNFREMLNPMYQSS